MKPITFPTPPAGFDPLIAPHEQLQRYGLPRRPDAQAEPVLRDLWDKAFSQHPTFVKPVLEETTAWRSRPRIARISDQLGGSGSGDGSLAGCWTGALVDFGLPAPDPAFFVYADWVVPTIQVKPAEPGSQTIGFWIGLGGWNNTTAGGSLLQAGICATLSGSSVNYFAVTEWAPAAWKVANFAVAPGDAISMLVCAPESDHGFVLMLNQRTQHVMSFGVSPPTGLQVDGSTVEWIVEAIDTEMPNFGSVAFTQCNAGNSAGAITLSSPDAFAYDGSPGDLLAEATILAAQNEVRVSWIQAI